jgi:branched-chain amino acid transport system permease protein
LWEFVNYVLNGLVSGSAYVMVALGLTLIFGILGVLQFAHGEVYMLGAYIAWTILRAYQVHYLVAVAGATLFGAALGALIELVCFRPLRGKPLFLPLVSSVGLSLLLTDTARHVWSPNPETMSTPYARSVVRAGEVFISQQRILVFVVAVIAIGGLYVFITRTLFGKALQAASMDLEATALMGINTNLLVSAAFAIGSALAAASGALLGPIFTLFPHMGTLIGLKAFVCVILGGFGDVRGTIVAGLLVGLAESFTVGYVHSQFKDASTFVILILVLLVRPTGLFRARAARVA